MILSDPDVRGVFVNIFGGITRGDEVARGIVQARDELGITLPLVVRMTGTNEEEGRRILSEAGIVPGTSAPDAARKIVELVGAPGEPRHACRAAPERTLMAILIDASTRVLVQGITGREGSFHTQQMQAYGTRVVAGVVPGRGGGETLGVPIFDTVAEAVARTGADTAFTIVPPPFAADAVMEAAAAGLRLGVCVTEGIPVLDMVRATAFVAGTAMRLIGPNCPGVMTRGRPRSASSPTTSGVPGGSGWWRGAAPSPTR